MVCLRGCCKSENLLINAVLDLNNLIGLLKSAIRKAGLDDEEFLKLLKCD